MTTVITILCGLISSQSQVFKAIDIAFNPKNNPKLGSAIFLHVMSKNKGYTAGCVAVERHVMKKLLTLINKDTLIEIRGKS